MRALVLLLAGLAAPLAAQPDLTVLPEALGLQPIVYPGLTATNGLEVRVENRGSAAAPATTATLYLSDDATLSADDIPVTTFNVGPVAAGAAITEQPFGVRFDEYGVDPGLYALIVEVDSEDEVAESDETNNTTFFAIRLGPEGTNVYNADYNFNIEDPYEGPVAPGAPEGFFNPETQTARLGVESDGTTPSPVRVFFEDNVRVRTTDDLLGDALGGNSEGPLRISGLARDGRTYDVYLYSGISGAEVTLGGETKTVTAEPASGFVEGVNYIVFRDLAPAADGTVEGTIRPLDGRPSYGVSGIQVFESDGTAVTGPAGPADRAELLAPFPNPADGTVRVPFRTGVAGALRLAVVDVLGREVAVLAEGPHAAGPHAVTLDTSALAPGRYTVRLSGDGVQATRPLTVVR